MYIRAYLRVYIGARLRMGAGSGGGAKVPREVRNGNSCGHQHEGVKRCLFASCSYLFFALLWK